MRFVLNFIKALVKASNINRVTTEFLIDFIHDLLSFEPSVVREKRHLVIGFGDEIVERDPYFE